MSSHDHISEAEAITYYLIGKSPRDKERKLYAEAMQKMDITLIGYERELWDMIMKRRWMFVLADGGLALLAPHSQLRRKIYVMLAILEASPAYANKFLSKEYSQMYWVVIGVRGVLAGIKGLLGCLLVKWMQWKHR